MSGAYSFDRNPLPLRPATVTVTHVRQEGTPAPELLFKARVVHVHKEGTPAPELMFKA